MTQPNLIEKIFWGRLDLIKATSFLKFEKNGKIQQLLHALKYKGVYQVGTTLGSMAARELETTELFNDIDLLVPVPIHKIKKEKRGYNQSHYIADGISAVTGIEVDKTSIVKYVNTKSQTRKTRFERFENTENTFSIKSNKKLKNKHILLVDDVLTTGSTIEACGNTLQKNVEGVQLSLLTIAFTY